MSFFSSLHEYVSNSVAGLSLSPKRFSLSRSDSGNGNASSAGVGCPPASPGSGRSASTDAACTAGSGMSSGTSQLHAGFPRVVPSPGVEALASRRRTLDTVQIPTSPIPLQRRPGSFRRQQPAAPPPEPPKPNFVCRRPSWPEIDVQVASGVHELDGSYFETLTATAWEQDSRRGAARKDFKTSFNQAQPPPRSPLGQSPCIEDFMSTKERDQLYVEMLYTIANAVGAPAPDGQYAHFKEDLYMYGQEAFGVLSDQHYRMLHMAGEEKPPIVVLSVVVVEAEGLEAKDANGFSDPYCMLGIKPMSSPQLPQSSPISSGGRTLSEGGAGTSPSGSHPELRKHHSFRLSFKRREGSGCRTTREQRDSVTAALPARYIRATSVKPHTLNPKWNEKFRFDIDDINTDSLHLDIWDHDDESSVLEAVSKLNEVRGVRGLGRFFKQVCQSARQSSQDDFLGCVTVPLQDIPCTGLDAWFKLEARSTRSSVQGRIHLRMWLSTREDRSSSEDENWTELLQHERLMRVFLRHERGAMLGGPAQTILHQHAAQADLSDVQRAAAVLTAHVNVNSNSATLLMALQDLNYAWNNAPDIPLNREQQGWLAETFSKFLDYALQQVRHHRHVFCGTNITNLDPLLKCLSTVASMPAFSKCCPFNKEIRSEIIGALRKGTTEWFSSLRHATQITGEPERSLVCLCTALYVELEAGLEIYHPLFESINGISYFSKVYKQTDKMLADEVSHVLSELKVSERQWNSLLEPELMNITSSLALYLELRDFAQLSYHLPPTADTRQLQMTHCHDWFEPAVARWFAAFKPRTLQRVRNAWRIGKPIDGGDGHDSRSKFVRHSTSAVDVVRMLDSLRELWQTLRWPEHTAQSLLALLLDAVAAAAISYGDLIRQTLDDSGYYHRPGPFHLADDMCIAVNDMEYVCRFLDHLQQTLDEQTQSAINDWRSLDMARDQLRQRIEEAVAPIGPQMHEALRKAVFHLAWSPDSLPTPQAICPLLEYLQHHLAALNRALLLNNFLCVLQQVWEAVLQELTHQIDAGNSSDTPFGFYTRLHEALSLLVNWWQADGDGLPPERIKTQTYYRVEQRIQYHRTDTEALVEAFYCQRLHDQIVQTGPPIYGTLSVRAYFNHDSLCVEVLHARDIIPLDPNGFSDPFVIIELLPRRLFSNCAEQQTNVHKKTLNPMFDECFEFSVTLEQCRHPSAMLLFTVMDHDVLTANDFAGEAFLSLGSIPGVSDVSGSIDNFHGLKPIELILMQQHEKNHPILQILETRPGDKLASDFVKKQKMRLAAT